MAKQIILINGGAILWLIALLSASMLQTSFCYDFDSDKDRAKNCEPKKLEQFRSDGQIEADFYSYYNSFGDHTSKCIERKIDALDELVNRQLDPKYYRALIEFHESMGKVRREEPSNFFSVFKVTSINTRGRRRKKEMDEREFVSTSGEVSRSSQ